MTFYEKLVEKAKEMGYPSATKFFDAAEVNTNARLALKKTGRLSDTYKMRCARVLKCSVGDINRMMSEARKEELQEQHEVKAEPVKQEPVESEPIHIREEKVLGYYIPNEATVVEEQPSQEPELEPVPEPEPQPMPEVPTEDEVLEEKIQEIKANAEPLLTYHDRIKEMARESLEAEYASMLRNRMLAVAIADLADMCGEFIQAPDPNKAVTFIDVASEIMKLKEE